MPSYRLELEVGVLVPGHAPDEVMAAAVTSVGENYHVDGTDITIAAGTPRIRVRFTVPAVQDAVEDALARDASLVARDAVADVAQPGRMWVLRRERGRWLPV